jgi:hypothetical protein
VYKIDVTGQCPIVVTCATRPWHVDIRNALEELLFFKLFVNSMLA